VEEISPQGIPWLLRSWELAQLDRLIMKLGLRWREVDRFFAPLANGCGPWKELTTEQEWREFWAILQSSELQSFLTARIAERRRAALAYLEAQGLNDDVPMAMADLGWFLTVQTALQKLSGWLKSAPAAAALQPDNDEPRDGASAAAGAGQAPFA